jgi:hypothetical protein
VLCAGFEELFAPNRPVDCDEPAGAAPNTDEGLLCDVAALPKRDVMFEHDAAKFRGRVWEPARLQQFVNVKLVRPCTGMFTRELQS